MNDGHNEDHFPFQCLYKHQLVKIKIINLILEKNIIRNYMTGILHIIVSGKASSLAAKCCVFVNWSASIKII